MSTTIEVSVESKCSDCGSEVDVTSSVNYRGDTTLTIDPCKKCLSKVEDEAEERGIEKGRTEYEEELKEKSEPMF